MSLFSPDANQHLTITAPMAAELPTGPYTVGVLFRNLASQTTHLWYAYQPDNLSRINLFFDGDTWVDFAQWDGNLDISVPHWRWLVVSKNSVTEAPRIHVADYAAEGNLVWAHNDTNATRGNWSPINRFSIGDEFGSGFRGDIACLAAFELELSDQEVESVFLRSSSTILNFGAEFFVHWPEAAGIASPFTDLAGGGIETVRAGSWSVSSDPVGYDFSLGRSGSPKVWDGTSWALHPAKVWDGFAWNIHPMLGHDGTGFVESK